MSGSNGELKKPVVEPATLMQGDRITVGVSAGSRLAGRHGVIVGKGTTKNQVRVLLDGSKSLLTLHARFVTLS